MDVHVSPCFGPPFSPASQPAISPNQIPQYDTVRLLDETAILACAACVDLNSIRAAMAETIEGSDYTSAQRRLSQRQDSSVTSRSLRSHARA